MIYVYFYESIFQDKFIHIIFIFANSNNLKVIDKLYYQCLTQIFYKTTSKSYMEGVYMESTLFMQCLIVCPLARSI